MSKMEIVGRGLLYLPTISFLIFVMVYSENKANKARFFSFVIDLLRAGELEVTELGVFIESDKGNMYLDSCKFELTDKGKDIDYFLVCYSTEESEKPEVEFPEQCVSDINLLRDLYTEIHKSQVEQGIEDKWQKYIWELIYRKQGEGR